MLVLIAFGALVVAVVVALALVVAVVALMRVTHLHLKLSDTERTLRALERRVEEIQRAGAAPVPSALPLKPERMPPAPPAAATQPAPPVSPAPPSAPPVLARVPPTTSDQRPPTTDQRLTTTDRRPTTTDDRPTTTDHRPTTNDHRPTTNNQRPYDWENLVGVKLFSWIAAIALALGAVFFLRYSIQAGWLQPPVRLAIGIITGLALLAGCEMKVARNYPVTANALDASGIVILFSTFFAAAALWHLMPLGAAFLFLSLVTVVAVLLALRRDSLFIAILGLLGGFLTPALLSTGHDNPIGLFGYLLLLNAGLAWVAYRKRWALLSAASVVLTTLYQWSWVAAFLTEAKLPLAAGIFLVFPILHFAALALGRRGSDDARETTFRLSASASGLLPLLFALYLAATPAYGAHAAILFGFLLCLDVLLLVASNRGAALLHLAGGAATNVVFLWYLAVSYRHDAWPGIAAAIAVFVLFYLASATIVMGRGRVGPDAARPPAHRGTAYAGASLLFTFPLLIALEPATAAPGLVFLVLFVLLAMASALALAEREGGVHFVAAFFALAAQAVWSARFLTDEARLLPALAIYLVFALFYIGVPILARRLNRPLEPQGAGVAILIVSLALLFFPAGQLGTDAALWGLALLLAILNVAVFVEASSVRRPVLSFISTVMSWFVICAWWSRASTTSLPGPGLLVVAAFAMLTLGGHVWNARRGEHELARNGVFLGLVGHLFLLFVAGQPALSIPPWPMLGVLLVLDLAAGVSALYSRQAALHVAAIAASALVLLTWLSHGTVSPWPAVAIICAGVVALVAVTWMWLARLAARGDDFTLTIDQGAALALLLAQVVAVFASGAGAPALAFLTIAHMVLLAGLLAVSAFRRWHPLAVAGVVACALAVATWHGIHLHPPSWSSLLVLSGGIYAVSLAYPLLLGRRAGAAMSPYLAAVLASGVFFLAARSSLLSGGYGGVIGILPVTQAFLMAGLLVYLLRLETPETRAAGRLALVAGAALAFITVAIPLQLDKEWITIGWALEGAALAWLYGRIPHRGLLLAASGLLAAVFVRLALNPAVLVYQPRGPYRIWNWYLYTYVVCAGALLVAARLFRETDDVLIRRRALPRARSFAAAGATVLLFLLLNIEIADVYSTGPAITFNLAGTLAQDMTYTLGWGVFAVALLVAGIAIRSRPARFGAIALLVATIIKGFLHDLARLGGLYRVASFVGLAICLALVAVVLQKFVLRPAAGEVHESAR